MKQRVHSHIDLLHGGTAGNRLADAHASVAWPAPDRLVACLQEKPDAAGIRRASACRDRWLRVDIVTRRARLTSSSLSDRPGVLGGDVLGGDSSVSKLSTLENRESPTDSALDSDLRPPMLAAGSWVGASIVSSKPWRAAAGRLAVWSRMMPADATLLWASVCSNVCKRCFCGQGSRHNREAEGSYKLSQESVSRGAPADH